MTDLWVCITELGTKGCYEDLYGDFSEHTSLEVCEASCGKKACELCPAPKIADCSQCCDVDSLWEFVTSPTNSINGPTWEVLGGGGDGGMGASAGQTDPLTGLPLGGMGGMGGGMGGTQEGGHRIKYTAKDSENCDGQGNKIQRGKATRMFHATEDFELTVKMLTNHESRKDHDIASLKLYKVSPCCGGVCVPPPVVPPPVVKPCGCECKQEKNNKWKAYNKTSTDGGTCVAEDEPKSSTEYESIEECLCAGCVDEEYCSGACCAPGDDPTPCEVITKNECEEKEWNYSGKDTKCMDKVVGLYETILVCPYIPKGACCDVGAPPALGCEPCLTNPPSFTNPEGTGTVIMNMTGCDAYLTPPSSNSCSTSVWSNVATVSFRAGTAEELAAVHAGPFGNGPCHGGYLIPVINGEDWWNHPDARAYGIGWAGGPLCVTSVTSVGGGGWGGPSARQCASTCTVTSEEDCRGGWERTWHGEGTSCDPENEFYMGRILAHNWIDLNGTLTPCECQTTI